MRGNSWLEEDLLASEDGLCSRSYKGMRSPRIPTVLSHNHPAYQRHYHTITLHTNCNITQSLCIPTVLLHSYPVYQLYYHKSPCIPTVLLYSHPVYQMYYHTVTLYTNCTITQSLCIPTALSHNHPAYQLYYQTITLYTNCTITQNPKSRNTTTVHQFAVLPAVPTVTKMTATPLQYLPDCTLLSPRDRTSAL